MKSDKKIKRTVLSALQQNKNTTDKEHLNLIRQHRIYIDPEIRSALKNSDCEERARLLSDSRIIMDIDAELRADAKNISAQFLSVTDELIHLLCVLEEIQRKKLALPSLLIPSMSVSGKINIDGHLYESTYDAIAADDYFLTYIGTVIRWMTQSRLHTDTTETPSISGMRVAGQHIPLSSTWQIFHEARTFWENNCASINREKNFITISSEKNELVQSFRVSLSRLRAFRFNRSYDKLNSTLVKTGTNKVGSDAYRNYDELRSAYLTSLQFHSSNLKEKIHGATLSQWVRAYQTLKEWAASAIAYAGTVSKPEELLIQTSMEEVLMKFRTNGIDESAGRFIAENMVFSAKSKDLLDAPFIQSGKKILFCPALTLQIEPAFSLESAFRFMDSQQTHELNFTGPNFEAAIRSELVEAGLPVGKVTYKDVDCDVAFILEETLYLCECKRKPISSDFHSYLKLEKYLRIDAVEQHERTVKFFSKNLQHVRRALKLPVHWKPASIRSLIITSAKLGHSIHEKGMTILDENTFHGFFSRIPLQLRNIGTGEVIQEISDSRLTGLLNVESFESFIKNPPSIQLHRLYLQNREVPLQVNSNTILIKDQECYGELIF